jgi:UDP-glucose 4-epimerase
MRKILITGGAGFIGSHLAKKYINSGDKVTVIDNLSTGQLKNLNQVKNNKLLDFKVGNVLDSELVDELVKNNDIIFHLAAVVGVKHVMNNPVDTIRVNILGTENILHSCSAYSKKVLIASTSEVYGKAMQYGNHDQGLNEDVDTVMGSTSVRRWSYATSKALDEFLALAYYAEKKLPVIIARFFNTIGPGQLGDYGMVVPIFIQKALSGEDIPIFGDGTQKRSFGYVGDAVNCIVKLVEKENSIGEVFNIGNTSEITINDLAETIIKRSNSSSKIKYISYEKAYGSGFEDMKRRKPNANKLEKAIGFKPEIDIIQIIDEMIIYFKSI